MSAIQGIGSSFSHPNPAPVSQAAAKPPAPKLEVQETAQQERQEGQAGRQELGERFSATA